MGEKGVLKKGEEKEAEKGLQNSRILKRMAVGRKFANFEGWGKLSNRCKQYALFYSN